RDVRVIEEADVEVDRARLAERVVVVAERDDEFRAGGRDELGDGLFHWPCAAVIADGGEARDGARLSLGCGGGIDLFEDGTAAVGLGGNGRRPRITLREGRAFVLTPEPVLDERPERHVVPE